MPYTGTDPQLPGEMPGEIDPTGWSLDPSFYYAVSPGGRFPGDVWSYLESVAAHDPSSAQRAADQRAKPDYTVPGWVSKIPGKLGMLLNRLAQFHQGQVRNYGLGPQLDNPLEAGNPYQGSSGPGAPYGPPGGDLRGLLDQGRSDIHDWDYGQSPGGQGSPGGAAGGKHRGGGGANFGPLHFTPYGGAIPNANPQFVDWQPTAPFTQTTGATRFVPGGGSSTPGYTPPVPTPQRPGKPGKPGKPGGVGGAGGGRRGAGADGGVDPRVLLGAVGGGAGPLGGATGGSSVDAAYLQHLFPDATPEEIQQAVAYYHQMTGGGAGGPGDQGGSRSDATPFHRTHTPGQGEASRGLDQAGYDTNYLDRGSPGWTRDPTTGIINTAGMPLPTAPSRSQFGSADAYINALHDAGWDDDSIVGLLHQGDPNVGWGSGGIVRGPNGEYMFADDPRAMDLGGSRGPIGMGPVGGAFDVGALGPARGASAGGVGSTSVGHNDQGPSSTMEEFFNTAYRY